MLLDLLGIILKGNLVHPNLAKFVIWTLYGAKKMSLVGCVYEFNPNLFVYSNALC